ncbi:MAG: DUF6456 domain-containing protein [Hyphomicrobiales bacterium]
MSDLEKRSIKLLRLIAGSSKSVGVNSGVAEALKQDEELLDKLFASALIEKKPSHGYSITKEGVNFLKRGRCDEGIAYQRQHQSVVVGEIDAGEKVSINQNESPLARLYHRRGRSGGRLLSKIQFEAGECLRRDFEASRMSPKLGMTLGPKVDGGGYRDAASSAMTGSIAAKQRTEQAMATVGPELGTLLLDVCCYLKGLELIERERQWPVRSAKVVLGVALNQLAVHYGLTN